MTPDEKAIFRNDILKQLEMSDPISMRLPTLQKGLWLVGFEETNETVIHELAYLISNELAAVDLTYISEGQKRYLITGKGRTYLEREGLA